MKFQITDNELTSRYLIISVITFHIIITLLFLFLEIPFYEQLSFELLNIITFFFIIFISRKDINIIGTGFVILSILLVSLVEINNIFIKNNYTYTGFNIYIINHGAISDLPPGGYPLSIPLGWIICVYASYLLTNFIFKNKSSLKISDVHIRIISDSMIVWTYAIFLEATGENLGWWIYSSKVVNNFFGVPIGTLYHYVLFSIFFSTIIRFSIYFANYKKRKGGEMVFFSKLTSISIYIPVMFVYSWIFILILAISKFSIFHWSLVVSGPPLFLYIIIISLKYQKVIEKNERMNQKVKRIIFSIFQVLSVIAYLFLVLFLIMILELYKNVIYMILIVLLIAIGSILIVREFIEKSNEN